MKNFLIIYGLTSTEADTDSTMLSRSLNFCRSVHSYGLAWSGRGGTIVLRSDVTLEKLSRDLVNSVDDDEFVAVLAIPDDPQVMYGGWLVDGESFLELLPSAVDVTYADGDKGSPASRG